MADLAKIQQETNAAYQPAITSIQNQQSALDKKLASTNADIKNQYAQQQAGLNRQRNQAAETASMQAAGSGGSFGGAANIANRKYYEQTFVPAQQSLNANQSAAYKAAQEARDTSYDSLASQLAQLQAEANKYALQRYDAAVEAERQAAEAEKNRRAQAAASNAYMQYLNQGSGGGGGGWNNPYVYKNGKWVNTAKGYNVKAGTVAYELAKNTGVSYDNALKQVLNVAATNNDRYSQDMLRFMEEAGASGFSRNSGKSYKATGNKVLDTLGIYYR